MVDFHNYIYTENLVNFYNIKCFSEKLKTSDFSQCFENYEGCNTYVDCETFLRNEIMQWFKKGRKHNDVSFVFTESKEICTNNVSVFMDISKEICMRNLFRKNNML